MDPKQFREYLNNNRDQFKADLAKASALWLAGDMEGLAAFASRNAKERAEQAWRELVGKPKIVKDPHAGEPVAEPKSWTHSPPVERTAENMKDRVRDPDGPDYIVKEDPPKVKYRRTLTFEFEAQEGFADTAWYHLQTRANIVEDSGNIKQ